MNILPIILTLVVIGVILWLINKYIPMAQPIKTILNIVVAIIVIIWLLKLFGLWNINV